MTKIESIQSKIIGRMQDVLTNEQLQRLENVLAIEFHGIEVQEECTQLVTSEVHWQKILRTFIASKRIENCSPGTLERYNDCVVKLVTALNKRLQDITTNDIRYYLAVYQEQRKISMSYLDTIRRYLSSFFAWVSDEGYISRNPMRRLKKIKVPRMIKKPFTQAEMEHLRCNAECQRDIAIMAFLYSTAARIGEVVRLNRKDIDWGNKEVIIYGEKGKKERRVYLTDDCAYHLHKYLLSRDDSRRWKVLRRYRRHSERDDQHRNAVLCFFAEARRRRSVCFRMLPGLLHSHRHTRPQVLLGAESKTERI